MNIAGFLMSMAGPLVLRAMSAVGFTMMTFTGVQAVINLLIGRAQDSWAQAPAAMLQLASLAGLPEAAGLICGAVIARVTLWQIAQATKLIFSGRT